MLRFRPILVHPRRIDSNHSGIDGVQSQASRYHCRLIEATRLQSELGYSKIEGRFEHNPGRGCLSQES
ncbi:hypothetical protein P8452_73266 [Trifolium repens]|nr:hypothetical protein P8452_73266 [Trifolium repens]